MKKTPGSLFRAISTTSSTVVFSAVLCLSVSSMSAQAADTFVPHELVPGPIRLDLAKADNSGSVNTDPMYIADRQAILNHVTAYAYLIDEGRWEEWYALFSDDFVFQTTTPDLGTIDITGKKAFRALIEERYIIPGKTSTAVRRHTMGNIHVAEQTTTTAKVRTYMLISKVPNADVLNILTTGTYNAELEKRNGKWIITRWYIETDARLSPSKVPEGFGKKVKWTPDPLMAIPGAKAGPLPGLISLDNHPYTTPASGPLFESAPEWSWNDIDLVIVDYMTDAKSAAAMLPVGVTTFPVPDLPGFSAVKHVWAHYRDSSFGPYNELIVGIPCLYKGKMYVYVPFIYVTTDVAMAGGREIGGWPKKIADIQMERAGNNYRLSFNRGSAELNVSATIGSKLFSTPLPANKTIHLHYPHNLTLPLPAPTSEEIKSVPLPTISLKIIPGVGAENPKPVVAQLIGADWNITGDFSAVKGISMSMHSSKEDPFEKLPVLRVVGGTYVSGDMILAVPKMKVLEDWLK